MDKRKLIIIPWVVIIAALLIAMGFGLVQDLKKEKEDKASSVEESIKESESESVQESKEAEAQKAAEEHKAVLLEIQDLVKQSGVQEEAAEKDEEEENQALTFPYKIPDSDLVVEKVIPYSGHFLEDGTGEEVKDSIAVILKNEGEDLDMVTLRMMAEGQTYNFAASEVAGGSSVFIQERSRAEYHNETISFCAASVQAGDPLELHENEIQIEDNKDNSFLVMNVSDKDYKTVRAFYKNYLEEDDLYVGGITYRIPVENLNSGAIMVSNSAHYISGYSKILGILLEE